MTEGSLITPEIQAMLGQETVSQGRETADRTAIRRYAAAIGDLNPLYLDEEYAKKTSYGGIVAPPTFVFDMSGDIFSPVNEDGRDVARITLPGLRIARGGNEYQFFEPVRPGDVINKRRKIAEIYEKEGKKTGKILFVVSETSYTNQKGQLLGINRETLMFFK
ncbi:MAG: MaoC family dehydratase N-terminal domain-containing protein [Chloroflexi bacterium]|nr:MaoC family dehydratase N-terminal domain-containing protein [Chloroflexota bacterium]